MLKSNADVITLPHQAKEYLKGINGVKGIFVHVRSNVSKNHQYYYTYKNKQYKLVLGSTKKLTGVDYLNSIFNYANVRDLIGQNPCQNIKILLHKRKSQKILAITDLGEFRKLIIDIHSFTECYLSNSLALRSLPYPFVRIGNFCRMRWQDIDFKKRLCQFTP